MAVDPVPWAINGSQLDTFVMREFASAATRNSQGIALPGDLKTVATGSPSGQVSVNDGSVVIRNAQSPGESYIGRVASDTLVSISPTSGSGRSDLLMGRIRDPDFSPWGPATSWGGTLLLGPYFDLFVQPGVSGATTKASQVVAYSAVAIARIDIPSSTTNITNAMIVDLRVLAQPRTGFASVLQQGPSPEDYLTLAETSYVNWPLNSIGVTVPEWATNCMCEITLNMVMTTGNAYADTRINFGGLLSTSVPYDHNAPPSNVNGDIYNGIPHIIFGDFDVTSLQGQTVIVKPEAKRAFTGSAVDNMSSNVRQQVKFDLRFVERII